MSRKTLLSDAVLNFLKNNPGRYTAKEIVLEIFGDKACPTCGQVPTKNIVAVQRLLREHNAQVGRGRPATALPSATASATTTTETLYNIAAAYINENYDETTIQDATTYADAEACFGHTPNAAETHAMTTAISAYKKYLEEQR